MAKILAGNLVMIMALVLLPIRKGGERFLPGALVELDEKDFLRKERAGIVKRAPEKSDPVNQKVADAADSVADTAVALREALGTGSGADASGKTDPAASAAAATGAASKATKAATKNTGKKTTAVNKTAAAQ